MRKAGVIDILLSASTEEQQRLVSRIDELHKQGVYLDKEKVAAVKFFARVGVGHREEIPISQFRKQAGLI